MKAKKKPILIFGAGLNQITLILVARNMGLDTIVIDPAIDAPGKIYADHYYQVGSDDYKKTKEIALSHNVNGIITSQMQNPLRLMARLADDIGLAFMKPDVIEKSLNKFLMKNSFIENEIPCAKGIQFKDKTQLNEMVLDHFSYPLILKPTDSHSSRGVYKVDCYEDIVNYLDETINFSSDGSFIIEEFIDGKEYSIEAITYKGNTTIVQYTEKFITPYPNTVEIGHFQPANLSDAEKKQIDYVVKKAVGGLGIDNSASHTELKMTDNRPVLIEIGARLGGDFISSYLTEASTGISMDRAAIQVALGVKPDLIRKSESFSCIKYIELEPGKKVVGIYDYIDILESPNVVFAHIFLSIGDTVPKITTSSSRPGCIIVKNENKVELINDVEYFENKLKQKIILE